MVFSNKYLTYEEYRALDGDLDHTPFNLLEFIARNEIDTYTFNRIKTLETIPQEVKMCVFDLINLERSVQNGVEQSGNAINYKTEELKQHKYDIIYKYLSNSTLSDGTPYLYRGI